MTENISLYKQVAESVTEAYPVHTGELSASPEVIEKISAYTGEGVVSFFTCKEGIFVYRTSILPTTGSYEAVGRDRYQMLSDGRMEITIDLPVDGARMVIVRKRSV